MEFPGLYSRSLLVIYFIYAFPPWPRQYKNLRAKKKKKESACNVGDTGSIPGSEGSLEKEMAAHSSILAWEIPWTEEPGGL